MTIASGKTQYKIGDVPVTGYVFSFSASELNSPPSCPMEEVVFDDSGKADIESMFDGLAEKDGV